MAIRSPTPSPPSSPTTRLDTAYYISPHSPSHLRFPPSLRHEEWVGRYFRCCRKGHVVATCRNPFKCGKCWGDGHTGTSCREKYLNSAAVPFWLADKPRPNGETSVSQLEPKFDELLSGTYPDPSMPMPEGRPQMVCYYVDRDEGYFREIKKLKRVVLLDARCSEVEPSIDLVAEFAAKTGLVSKEEVTVGILTNLRYLIHLPNGLAPETFIRATPARLWDEGFSFRLWDPLENATVKIPAYKVLIELIGIPSQLYCEKEVIRAVSRFGGVLGHCVTEGTGQLGRMDGGGCNRRVRKYTTQHSFHGRRSGDTCGGATSQVVSQANIWRARYAAATTKNSEATRHIFLILIFKG